MTSLKFDYKNMFCLFDLDHYGKKLNKINSNIKPEV